MNCETVFFFVCITGIFFPLAIHGDVFAFENENSTETFRDEEADFGTSIGKDGLMGFLSLADPIDACGPIADRTSGSSTYGNVTLNNFVLIRRGNCDFATKVLYAQEAKFDAAIVYNVDSDDLVKMGSTYDDKVKLIVIPSVFVGATDGFILEWSYLHTNGVFPYVDLERGSNPFSIEYYLFPFCVVLGICVISLLGFFLIRYIRDRRHSRRNRLSRQRLKKLPVKLFHPGDEYDACAICLEDYMEGEKLRILPCKHAYHCECVDPWLTSNKRVCPLCKSRVLSDDETSDSDADDTNGQGTDERAPLLRNASASSPNAPRYATGFGSQNPFSRIYSSSPPSDTSSSYSSDNPSYSRQTWDNEAAPGTLETQPVNNPDQLIVFAGVSPLDTGIASSMFSCRSSEDFSCRSEDDSQMHDPASVARHAVGFVSAADGLGNATPPLMDDIPPLMDDISLSDDGGPSVV